ncbi:MAG: serpin family protein [Gemmatimonadota bacterium]|nr:serpin family protein [Gemmatimonadota bacterium]MDH3477396.1 serpin family protein [Gemmatimonadota bacterium]MDH3569290.1 serpin family protein [Gemmatimonadota bacterium]MDH5548767.1 serpin family protein [Gemmatimonadota bacterium]
MTERTMHQRHLRFSVAALLVGAGACGDGLLEPILELPRQLTVAEEQLVEADNRFAFKLFGQVNTEEEDGANVFISPLSVGMALGMTYNGAAGTTRDAMQETLELQGLTLQEVNESYQSLIQLLIDLDPRVEMLIANSIWYRQGIQVVPAFIDLNRQYFDAEVTALNFDSPTAANAINDWVHAKTRGRIDRIIEPPIPSQMIMYLINAIYFKGDWTSKFDKDRTRNAPFTLTDGSQTSVPTMSSGAKIPVRAFGDSEVLVADLPYGGRAFSMTLVVPHDESRIIELSKTLTRDRWDAWITALQDDSIEVVMPKFTLEYDVTLNDVLKALGMAVAFSDTEADFSNLYAGPERAYISEVKHKTFVEVNEEGTTAAAVTSVGVGVTSVPTVIRVDRPFIFAIRERLSGTILFMGRMMNPGA